jgi:hypothetical protein
VAHSHWLHSLVERGLVGLGLEIALWLLAVFLAYRSGQRWLAAALVCMGVHGLVGEGLEYTQGAVLWWYLIGLATRTTRSDGLSVRWLGGAILIASAYPLVTYTRTIRAERRIELAQVGQAPLGAGRAHGNMGAGAYFARCFIRDRDRASEGRRVEGGSPDIGVPAESLPMAMRPKEAMFCFLGYGEQRELLILRRSLLVTCINLYPTDPWFIHEYFRQRKDFGGCPSVLQAIDSLQERIELLLAPPPVESTVQWPTWRHRLSIDRVMAETVRSRLDLASGAGMRSARNEWLLARAMCADSL